MLQSSFKAMSDTLASLIVAAAAGKRVFEIVDLEPDIRLDAPGAVELGPSIPTIEVRDLHFTYQMRPDAKVFAGISFTIPAGSTVGLVGRSGAGKTTLVSLLLRYYDPQQGSVLLDGRPLAECGLRGWLRRIG